MPLLETLGGNPRLDTVLDVHVAQHAVESLAVGPPHHGVFVRLGQARVFYAFLEGLAYAGELQRMEGLARDQALGGWGACGW